LDRCRSYRQDISIKCTIIALNDELITQDRAQGLDQHKVARITFLDTGFLGSQKAALSYSPDADMGYIWLVDTANGRDCKGEWHMDGDKGSWWIRCKDGLKAEGIISSPSSGNGTGQGQTLDGQIINFVFSPTK